MKGSANLNFNLGGNEDAPQASSIDRFFWAKGVRLFGYSNHQWQLAGVILSVSHSIAAVIFIGLSLISKNFPIILPLIFSIAAVVSLVGTFWNSWRIKKSVQSEVRLSRNGRQLLHKIGQHIGWHDHDSPEHLRGNQLGLWWLRLMGAKTASQVLTPAGARLLEAGCIEHNRIYGLMNLAKGTNGRSTTLLPQIRAASDEAIVSLINQVALHESAPETQSAIEGQCQVEIDKLHELADRYEELISGPITLEDRLSSTTVMDGLLDHMRLEAQAHEELRTMNRQDS
jgi:hypothetical protein